MLPVTLAVCLCPSTFTGLHQCATAAQQLHPYIPTHEMQLQLYSPEGGCKLLFYPRALFLSHAFIC